MFVETGCPILRREVGLLCQERAEEGREGEKETGVREKENQEVEKETEKGRIIFSGG